MTQNDKAFIAQKIRTQYVNKTPTDLDELKKLDAQVKRPATVYGYTFGIVSALIMGAGMSKTAGNQPIKSKAASCSEAAFCRGLQQKQWVLYCWQWYLEEE